MKLNCLIIDDEPLALDLLESYVKDTPFLTLQGRYASAVTALQEMGKKEVDLIFVDIQMPDLNGLEFSRLISPQQRVIITTAFDQYALEGYKVNALDYLLKPISYADFLQASRKALQWFGMKSAKADTISSIMVKSEYKLIQIELKKILFVEGLKDYIKIYEEGSAKPILSLMTMKAIEEQLPSSQFIRVHRSYIVQKDKIRIIERGRIIFGDHYIPVGDNYKQAFDEFLREKMHG